MFFVYSGPSGAMNATASFLSNGGEVIIRMRGLPYTADVRDVVSVSTLENSVDTTYWHNLNVAKHNNSKP